MTMIYYLFCVFSVFFAFLAQKKNSRTLFVLSILFICFIAGLRSEMIGIDTKRYYEYIEIIQSGKINTLSFLEKGFIVFSQFLLKIINHPWFVIFVSSSLTVFLFFARFWTLRHIAPYYLSVFFYLAFHFQISLNIMRQFLAVSIIFFATYFIEKKKIVFFIIAVLIAMTIHTSSLIALLIPFIYWWFRTPKTSQRLLLLVGLCMIAPIGLYYIRNQYSGYFEQSAIDIGIMIFVKLGILCIFLCLNQSVIFSKTNIDIAIKTISVIYIFGLGLTFLGYIFPFIDRIGLPFMMFEPICMAIMCTRKSPSVFRITNFALAAFIILTNFLSNPQEVFPYSWIL